MHFFSPLRSDVRLEIDKLISLIDELFPLPHRFRATLPRDIAELSRLFTFGRRDRDLSYLGRPNLLSAYLRFFLPWNIYRLCRLLPSLNLDLKNGDRILDLGSGPLTFPIALWLSRPDLRSTQLEFHCLDRTALILEKGKKIFVSLTAKADTWNIKTIRGEYSGRGIYSMGNKLRQEAVALVTAINIFNEIFWDLSPADREGLKSLAGQSAGLLSSYCNNGTILIVEPGIPRSGEFISKLRSSFLEHGFKPVSPCLHKQTCPFPGGLARKKTKWCHFSFNTDDASKNLLKLSAAAGIPKERAVMSFLMVKKNSLPDLNQNKVARIISDPFPVGTYYCRYACSENGAILVRASKEKIKAMDSGAYSDIKITGQTDTKSGALIGELL